MWKLALRILLEYLIHFILRIGDFTKGDPIRREPIVLDQYGGCVIPNNVQLSTKLTLLSQAPLPSSS